MKRIIALAIGMAAISAACSSGNVFAIEVGQCFNDPDNFEEVSDVEMVDCSDPHDNEAYHVYDMTQDDFPGDAAVQDLAQIECVARFDAYVGSDYATSSLDIGAFFPTNETWDQNDREVICFLYDLDFSKLTGLSEGSSL
ncbi:septum formation family protein [Acidimicrobiaceae bacterium AH-315-P05]|nr:septum formation family protein [Acidimicrobiaceae bacterium AH-315-P05]